MKAHLAFLCNGRCQWCKSRWDCGKARRFLAKIFGCKDWRYCKPGSTQYFVLYDRWQQGHGAGRQGERRRMD